MSIVGLVLAWCGSGLNNVTEDWGRNKKGVVLQVRGYFFLVAVYDILKVRNLDSCGPHG